MLSRLSVRTKVLAVGFVGLSLLGSLSVYAVTQLGRNGIGLRAASSVAEKAVPLAIEGSLGEPLLGSPSIDRETGCNTSNARNGILRRSPGPPPVPPTDYDPACNTTFGEPQVANHSAQSTQARRRILSRLRKK